MNKKSDIKVLDCTIRDGGYYCDWDFDDATVKKYLSAISSAKIDIIEIGFRFFSKDSFLGAYAYSTDDFLRTINLPDNVKIAVMINAAELIAYGDGPEAAVDKLFTSKDNSPVDIVRIATHAKDILNCKPIVQKLNNHGYSVILNLMQVDSLSSDELTEKITKISELGQIDVLYFADSFGCMDPESVFDTIQNIKAVWNKPIGIHTHDNKGQALANCVAALKSGVKYLDSTLLGMGRGAGNVKTESLIVELVQRGYGQYYPDAVFPLVMNEFSKLHEKYGWGTNICYFLSAVHGIHPTYIQEMLNDNRYSTEQILSSINFLKSIDAPFYSFENMLRSFSGIRGNENGEWDAQGWIHGREVLILGAGQGTKRYINAIVQYVKRKKAVVLCLNINEAVPEEIVDAYVACHESRILIESDHYHDLKKPLILPLSRVPEGIKNAIGKVNILDYGLRIHDDEFIIGSNGCVLEKPLALFYAISVATAGNAKKILFAGMDGYEESDPRQAEINTMLENYSELDVSLPIIAITPTTYSVEVSSIFSPEI